MLRRLFRRKRANPFRLLDVNQPRLPFREPAAEGRLANGDLWAAVAYEDVRYWLADLPDGAVPGSGYPAHMRKLEADGAVTRFEANYAVVLLNEVTRRHPGHAIFVMPEPLLPHVPKYPRVWRGDST